MMELDYLLRKFRFLVSLCFSSYYQSHLPFLLIIPGNVL